MRYIVRALLITVLALGLAGCSGLRLVDAQVSAASTLADASVLKGARYRFEQTPLQTPSSSTTSPVSAAPAWSYDSLAEQALAEVGLVRDEANAAYTVLLGVRITPYLVDTSGRPYSSLYPYGGFSTTWGLGAWRGSSLGWGIGGRFPPTTHYRYELSLLMRDVRSGALVYETQAVHDGPWNDSKNILGAMFQAALKDFPEQVRGPRRINIEIPR